MRDWGPSILRGGASRRSGRVENVDDKQKKQRKHSFGAANAAERISVTPVRPSFTTSESFIFKTRHQCSCVNNLFLFRFFRQNSVQVRICFLKFADPNDVAVAMHLSNTVFIDRALVVSPYSGMELPDESKGLEMLSNVNSFGVLEPKLPATLTNQVEGVPPNQMIRTLDPRLSMHNLPTYPLLPASTDPRRLEEIRRTVVVVNIDPSMSERKVIQFFSSAGEVKVMRFCSKKGDDTKYAMIEFAEQESIVPAMKLNNKKLGNNTIKVTHSTQAINKPVPQNKSNEAAQKEIEEEVNRVKEAQQSLLAAPPEKVVVVEKAPIKPVAVEKVKEKEVKKSRSRSRSRSKSRSRRRSSSRSRRRKDRSRSRKRSRSRSRKRTRSRSRSRSRDRRKRSRSRSRDRRKKSRSRERRRRSRSRSRSRKKSPRPSRDRGRDRSKDRTKDRVEKTKEKKDRTKDRERKEKKKDKKEKKERIKSPSSKESSDEKFDSHDLEILRSIR
uniref:EOG090X0EEC n=1 Tax=Alona affinis TaxID=381656 RepID=A0A9N6WRD4_9CRUS|nr:EOG090X0EEC [Alona affinis]